MLSSEVPPAPGPTTFPAPPPGVGGQLAAAAERCLQHLPERFLRALATGLRLNADELAPGALFRDRDTGGCAVGIALRELAPDAFRFGRIEFWLWHRWRRGVELDVARRFPHLQQLQRVFDDAVAQAQDTGHAQEPTKAVGLWLAASAETELRVRELRARRSGPWANAHTRWTRRRAHQPRAGGGRPQHAGRGTASCS
jgi:hypothetical protein